MKTVYVIDFGLAKRYKDVKTGKHIEIKGGKSLVGTARYASINALRGFDQSRRDDLEAVGYVLAYFLRGSLPWQGMQVKNKDDRYQKIMEKKKSTFPEDLCEGFPFEFERFISYSRSLLFEEDPDRLQHGHQLVLHPVDHLFQRRP